MTNLSLLEEWRQRQGLSVTDAAIALKISRKTWYEWIAGRNLPSPARAARIEEKTGIKRSALVAWAEAQACAVSS
ncbi:MAG: helix-turn-helix protein [Pseudomonadota bacterium]